MSVDQQIRRDAAIQRAREYSRFRSAGLQGDGLHLVVLLAELEQAEKWANTMEHERDWERDVVHSELLARAEAAEARLANVHALVEALKDIDRRDRMSDYGSIYAAPGEFANVARDALATWESE